MIRTEFVDTWGKSETSRSLRKAISFIDSMLADRDTTPSWFMDSGRDMAEYTLDETPLDPWDFSGPILEIFARPDGWPVTFADLDRMREELSDSLELAGLYPDDDAPEIEPETLEDIDSVEDAEAWERAEREFRDNYRRILGIDPL